MIYLVSSVALAYLLAEDRYPSDVLWRQTVVSSRLLECEVWNQINACRLQDSPGHAVRGLIGRINWCQLGRVLITPPCRPSVVRSIYGGPGGPGLLGPATSSGGEGISGFRGTRSSDDSNGRGAGGGGGATPRVPTSLKARRYFLRLNALDTSLSVWKGLAGASTTEATHSD
jgi:hypothetical protein